MNKKSTSRKWCWYYDRNLAKSKSWRSDHHMSFITSVQDNDVFRVFLNFETKKLIIYNARSKQSEVFTGVEGEQLHPVISPSRPQYDYYDEEVSPPSTPQYDYYDEDWDSPPSIPQYDYYDEEVCPPSRPQDDYYDEEVECETHLSLVVDKPAIL